MSIHEPKELKKSLNSFGELLVKLDYHKPSNTHIAYCMAIGRQGVKGYGHTADTAFERYIQDLTSTITKAAQSELKYWAEKCEREANSAKREAHILALTREPLSCQVGLAVPSNVGEWILEASKKQGISRNEFATNLLRERSRWLESRVEREPSQVILHEIKAEAGKGETEWSQHVTPDLQATLILLAQRFDISVALLARYFHVKEYQATSGQKANQLAQSAIYA
jgi:predicted HicB family RNase H-like nuclease